MNHEYIFSLIIKKRYGKLLHLVIKNIHNWSVQDLNDIKYIITSRDHRVLERLEIIFIDYNIRTTHKISNNVYDLDLRKHNKKIKNNDDIDYYYSLYWNYRDFYSGFYGIFYSKYMNVALLKIIIKYMSVYGANICYLLYNRKHNKKIKKYMHNPKYINMNLNIRFEKDKDVLYTKIINLVNLLDKN